MQKRFIDVSNQRFNRLVAIRRDNTKPRGGDNPVYWICRCDCGKTKSILGNNLTHGKTKSCGCMQKEAMKKNGERLRGAPSASSKRDVFGTYRRRSKELGIEMDIEFNEFISITQKKCFYCESSPSNKICHRKHKDDCFTYNGLDRLNSSKGYTRDNVVPCCYTCNKAKSSLTLEQFINWVKIVSRNLDKMNQMPGFHYLVYSD